MTRIISVMPADDGWQVSVEGEAAPFLLNSGSAAEDKAIELARNFVRRGERATVQVQLPDGSLAARSVAPSATAQEGWLWRAPQDVA